MKKLVLAATLAALASAAAVAIPLATASRTTTHPTTITLIEHLTGNTFVDVPPEGSSIGDELVFDSPMFDETDTRQIARGYGRCTRVGPSETLHECTAFLDIDGAGGLISLQCSADFATPDTFCSVTGGTGRFSRARGEMIGTNGPDETVRFVLRLAR